MRPAFIERLRAVPWHRLDDAYGAAVEVPALLIDLAHPDPQRREDAAAELYGSIFHQGSTYAASAAAIPVLLDLLGDAEIPEREQVARMLVTLACCGTEPSSPLSPELPGAAAVIAALTAEYARVRGLLDAPEAWLREIGAGLLGHLRGEPRAAPDVRSMLDRGPASAERAAGLLSLASLGEDADRARFGAALTDDDLAVRAAAAVGLAALGAEAEALPVLVEVALAGSIAEQDDWVMWQAIGPWPSPVRCALIALVGLPAEHGVTDRVLRGLAGRPAVGTAIADLLELLRRDSWARPDWLRLPTLQPAAIDAALATCTPEVRHALVCALGATSLDVWLSGAGPLRWLLGCEYAWPDGALLPELAAVAAEYDWPSTREALEEMLAEAERHEAVEAEMLADDDEAEAQGAGAGDDGA